MSLTIGTKVGAYEVLSLVGKGGMGEVYRARDTQLDRDVALKLVPDAMRSDPERLSRFRREAKVLASLNHSNIAQIYGLEQTAGTPCIVMELLEGETLRARLAREPLPEGKTVDVAIAVADALASVHAKGITHRDLKPENIFLTSDGRVKILDFGLARWQPPESAAAATAATPTETAAGLVMGTVGYMSPEQIRGGNVEAPSDIFSLGCVMYEMLTSRRAFDRQSTVDTLAAILHEQPPALDALPGDVGRLIARCLAKKPDERFHSARDLAIDLRSLGASRDGPDARHDSLAVLPFTNAGGADAEYLSDGIAESLINNFSQIARLRVVPRSVAFRYKGQDVDPRVVGRELGVRMLLSGKVVERGGRLSVQVELVDAAANKQLWGERLHRPLADIFEVEEEISRQIADKLHVRLSGEEKKQLARRYTENGEAYQLYLKARFHFLKRTPEALQKGIHYCEQAIEKDENFALAFAALTDCYLVLHAVKVSPAMQMLAKARAAALRAVEADDTLAESHNSLAYTRACCDWDWIAAERSFRRALELNPASWITHDWYALSLSCQGRLDEALAHNRRAQQLEPTSVVLHHHAAWLLWLSRRYDEAVDQSAKVLELDSSFSWGYLWRGLACEQQGKHEESIAALRTAAQLTGDNPLFVGSCAHACAVAGRLDDADFLRRQLDERSQNEFVEPYAIALMHAGLGDADSVFECLERAFDVRSSWITLFLKCDPRFDAIRPDPRYRNLLRRMRLEV